MFQVDDFIRQIFADIPKPNDQYERSLYKVHISMSTYEYGAAHLPQIRCPPEQTLYVFVVISFHRFGMRKLSTICLLCVYYRGDLFTVHLTVN